jgi:hypothetical protein
MASRILLVIIHDLNMADINECKSVLGGVLRGVEFIYKKAGVNRPFRSKKIIRAIIRITLFSVIISTKSHWRQMILSED